MKITVTIDCTPDEARGFFGLPDIKALQEQMISEVADAVRGNLRAMDPKTMIETWLPTAVKGLEQWQEMFRKAVKPD